MPFLVAVILGDKILTETIKQLVDRARPALEPVAATLGPSSQRPHLDRGRFLRGFRARRRTLGPRAWPALAGAAVGIAVGVVLRRVLLDVHWLTDVFGGLALGPGSPPARSPSAAASCAWRRRGGCRTR